MSYKIPELENSVLIVAHPDDEVLWFSSLLDKIDLVIMVFLDYDQQPSLGIDRAEVIAVLPFEVICLGIPESGSFGLAHWEQPQLTTYGLSLGRQECNYKVSLNYANNFNLIRTQLKPYLSPNMNVYTHNPWGEYGHEDHVQVYRIVESLRKELGFNMRVSCYISSRSNPLAKNYAESDSYQSVECCIDSQKSNKIADLYKHSSCWTWADDWTWYELEYFLPYPLLNSINDGRSSLIGSRHLRKIPSSVSGR